LCVFLSGDVDFESPENALSFDISGPANQEICRLFLLIEDGRVEPLERFTIELRTEDISVELGTDEAEVLLMDSDGKCEMGSRD
jgi:hypothetical protein